MKSQIICAMLQDWKSHYLSYQKQGLFIGTGAKDTTLETYSKHQYTVCGRFRSKLRNGSGSPEETKRPSLRDYKGLSRSGTSWQVKLSMYFEVSCP